MSKNKILISLAAVLVVVGAVVFYVYQAYNPQIMISKNIIEDEDYYYEQILATYSKPFNISSAQSVQEEIYSFFYWCESIDNDISENYHAPLNITVSFQVSDGQTTVTYDGYATDKNGEKIQYTKEETFNYEFIELN